MNIGFSSGNDPAFSRGATAPRCSMESMRQLYRNEKAKAIARALPRRKRVRAAVSKLKSDMPTAQENEMRALVPKHASALMNRLVTLLDAKPGTNLSPVPVPAFDLFVVSVNS
jgi:hypothetical protein